MRREPFKFLDAYTLEDSAIFYGRSQETEEIYSRVFYSDLLLVYGPSGSGKTSLLQCGLANKFDDADWLALTVRRNQNIIESLRSELASVTLTKLKPQSSLSEIVV